MRLLQMHWAFPPTTGGVESHVADLSAGLARRGCHVTVVTGERNPERCSRVTVLRSDALNLERISTGVDAGTAYDSVVVELADLLAAVRPDVVHGHNLHHFSAAPALALDELSVRHGFRLHHTFHETWPDVLHDRPVYRNWTCNYAVSRHVRDECRDRIGFSPTLFPLGIDSGRFQGRRPTLSGGRDPTILHPARLLPWKGVDVSVRMMALLADQGLPVRLIITDTRRIADWDGELAAYRARILTMIRDLSLDDRVELRPTSYQEMPELYELADVVVYPTVGAEPYGLVPLEAMSARRPVVASRCGGIPETVVDGVTGWLTNPGDADALATSVAWLLTNPDQARQMGAAGRRRVCDHFDLGAYIDRMLLSYRAPSIAK